MAVSLGLRVPDFVTKESIVHHARIRLAPTPISLVATSLLVFSVHSTAFNMKETSYDLLLDIVLLAGSSYVAIVAPRLSWNTNVSMEKASNPASIWFRSLFQPGLYTEKYGLPIHQVSTIPTITLA